LEEKRLVLGVHILNSLQPKIASEAMFHATLLRRKTSV
jgi:hypothetical protein